MKIKIGKRFNKLLFIFELIRYRAAILIIIASFLCIFILNFNILIKDYILVLGAILCLSSGGFALNDYIDIKIDIQNAPWRPIPSKKIERKTAMKIAIASFTSGIIFSLLVNFLCFILSSIIIICLILYSNIFKKFGIIGNFVTAFLSTSVFIFYGLIAYQISPFKYPILFTFLVVLSREILSDIRDIKGDRANRRFTLPILIDKKYVVVLSLIIFFAYTILSFIPYVNGTYNFIYFLLNSILFPMVIISIFIHLLSNFSQQYLVNLISTISKFIHIGILGIVIGTL